MEKNIDTFLHYGKGKAQSQRFLEELNPESFELHDFTVADWVLFAYNFAQHINYFDKNNNATADGNWRTFIDSFGIKELIGDSEKLPRRESVGYKKLEKSISDKLALHEKNQDIAPHLGLFVSFIKLLDFSKSKFNNLTKRHLDFYYEEILQIEKRAATPDKAYVIFELAKKAIQERIPEGTLLDAGKDANGKKLTYKTNEELIASQAKVVSLKSFYNDACKQELKVAHKADSLDGIEEELPEESNYWWPFGYTSKEENYKELSDANLGFSVASSLFKLEEGTRTITLTIDYQRGSKGKLEDVSENEIKENLEIRCSGKKEWLSGAIWKSISNTENALKLTFELTKDFPAVVGYDSKVLLEKFSTDFPVIRFLIKGKKRYALYEALSEKAIRNITIDVSVTGIKTAILQNDNSTLKSDKPFYPFTAQPLKNSNFEIKHPEVFSKNWKNIDVTINWKNTPASITDLYKAYAFNSNDEITKEKYKKDNDSVVSSDTFFKAKSYLFDKEEWKLKDANVILFNKTREGYKTSFSVTNTGSIPNSAEAIRLSLNQTALQDVYPKLYTLALTEGTDVQLIPESPYIPYAEDIELSYSATDSVYSSVISNNSIKNKGVQLFHEDVFGQYEKETTSNDLLPVYETGGELYIGLSATAGQQVSLLVQVLEGSENPLSETFSETEKVSWEILSNNVWGDLSDDILLDETNNFLQTGIVKFNIPKTIRTANTRLPEALIWVKAKMNKSYDAVCKVQGVFTQALLATFTDKENDLTHLKDGLPAGAIGKLITRVPQVKAINQKYNSFGGIYQETDIEYYRRISERLRHKNRAITQWDYEQLILQEFPEVFRVKCLKHTSENSYMDPGNVTLVVVPSTKNKNAFDIYQPRVSSAKLSAIKAYINDLNTMHVNAIVMNPNYQELRVVTAVKFFKGYDENFYKQQLDIDIQKYITPWAFDTAIEMSTDIDMNKNLLVNYIEQLPYVDYIDDLKIFKKELQDNEASECKEEKREIKEEPQGNAIIKAEPKAILVSAKKHEVTIATRNCNYKHNRVLKS